MSLHPILALDQVIEEYRDYLLTEFRAKDPGLRAALERALDQPLFLAQEPFFQAHRPFKHGKRWGELPIDPKLAQVMEERARRHGSMALGVAPQSWGPGTEFGVSDHPKSIFSPQRRQVLGARTQARRDGNLIAPCPDDRRRPGVWRVNDERLDERIDGQHDLVALNGKPVIPPSEVKFYPAAESLQGRAWGQALTSEFRNHARWGKARAAATR